MSDYRTISGTSTFTYEEKRSRFIAVAAFADTEEKALAVLNRVRAANRTARHNVYAYVLRQDGRTRYSDDGEPAKTAGTPVLEAIGHAGTVRRDCGGHPVFRRDFAGNRRTGACLYRRCVGSPSLLRRLSPCDRLSAAVSGCPMRCLNKPSGW